VHALVVILVFGEVDIGLGTWLPRGRKLELY
jgi:hypothetical protein